jgi:hypothetical protein
MRVLGGAGGLLACGVAGVAVAVSPRPADAPLKPPADPSASLSEGAPSPSAPGGEALVIPATRPCSGSGVAMDPSLRQVVEQLRSAPTRAARQAILQQLPADQRQQVVALLRNRTRTGGQCGGSAHSATGSVPPVQPDVIDGGSSPPPVTNSYVS